MAGRRSQAGTPPTDGQPEHRRGPARLPASHEPVARRTATGWRVGDEEVSDLTSAMVLADLLAADLPTQAMPTVAGHRRRGGGDDCRIHASSSRPSPSWSTR